MHRFSWKNEPNGFPSDLDTQIYTTRRPLWQVGGAMPRLNLNFLTFLNCGKGALVSSVVHLPVTFKSLVWPCDLHWSLASFRRDSDKPSNLDMVSVLIRLQPQQRHSLGLAEPTMFGRPCLNRRLLVTARVCSPRLCGADQQHLGVLKGSSCLTLGNELCPNRDH